jgi:site-specific DNA recombinase
MATVQGAAVIELIVDGGESAKDLKRPGMDRLLTLVDERKVDTVIIAKLDRLTRSVKDLAELLERFQRRGVSLVSVAESLDTGSAAGRLVINIMTAVSQWEREAIGERTRDAMQHKRSKGRCVGNLAYGYRLSADGEHVEPEPSEQKALAQIRSLRQQGRSLRSIASALNAQALRTRRGTGWRHDHVLRIIGGGLASA